MSKLQWMELHTYTYIRGHGKELVFTSISHVHCIFFCQRLVTIAGGANPCNFVIIGNGSLTLYTWGLMHGKNKFLFL